MFVDHLLRRVGRSIILVIDRYSVHHGATTRLLARHAKRLSIEWLPAYAPELNPDEQVWNQTKHADLANCVPDDVLRLGRPVAASLRKTRSQQSLLRSSFNHAELPL